MQSDQDLKYPAVFWLQPGDHAMAMLSLAEGGGCSREEWLEEAHKAGEAEETLAEQVSMFKQFDRRAGKYDPGMKIVGHDGREENWTISRPVADSVTMVCMAIMLNDGPCWYVNWAWVTLYRQRSQDRMLLLPSNTNILNS